jgi:hypothetical protein
LSKAWSFRATVSAAEMSQLRNIVVGMHQFAVGYWPLVSEPPLKPFPG